MTAPEPPRAGFEASRLLAAAQEWVRTSAPHLAPVSPDGETCPCPLCRAVVGLRDADPESVATWVDSAVAAVGSLVAQAGDLIATAAGQSDAAADGAASPDDGDTGADPEPSSTGRDEDAPRSVRRIALHPADDPEKGPR